MRITENRRIVLNIVASYGRSLFALACGLVAGRWTLLSLGETDYGLMGVVGGLMTFIAFFNSVLAGAIGRYYAISVGRAKVATDAAAGLEECRRWFNTALSIHTLVPLVLLLIGYPIGVWVVREVLVIPPERVEACVWVFRCSCVAGFVGMVNVPFTAFYGAKQYIAELTVYSVVATALNVGFLYYMVTHPGVWLVKLACWTCCLSVVPQVIICLRALKVFPECRVNLAYWYDLGRLRQVASYAGWQLCGCLCGLLRTQGMSVLVNLFFGPRVNAAQGVANSVNGHSTALAGAMLGAFMPAITTACGEGNLEKMRALAFQACKFAVLLALIFMLPLALELPEVMRLWLKQPPQYAVGLCWCLIATYLIDVCTNGHMVVVNASGKIAQYHVVLSAVNIFSLPLAYLLARQQCGVYVSVGGVLMLGYLLNSLGRVLFARKLMQMSLRYWVFRVVVPLVVLIAVCLGVGWLPHLWLGPSFGRIVATGVIVEAVFLPLAWGLVLTAQERSFVKSRLARFLPKAWQGA